MACGCKNKQAQVAKTANVVKATSTEKTPVARPQKIVNSRRVIKRDIR